MGSDKPHEGIDTALRELYPQLSDDKLEEVQHTLDRYLDLILRIYNRLEGDGLLPSASLTEGNSSSTIKPP